MQTDEDNIWVSDIDVCHYCQQELVAPLMKTLDHIVPRSKGGLDERFNIVFSCQECNSRKADEYPIRCNCAKCRKAKRIHWERFRISATNKGTGWKPPEKKKKPNKVS